MRSHELGFSSSWKMLTRDKGWVKPLLVLTLVGWIPVLGQIALLGYGFEWARLTAWGVDSAPKQSGVKYGKVLRTGAVTFLVALSMSVVLSLLNMLIFGAAMPASAFPGLSGVSAQGDAFAMLYGGRSIALYLILLVVNLLFGTFISVAMMRATIYDGFAAGWRLDRIFQMIGRDVAGFFKVYWVSLVAGVVNWLYSVAVSFLALLVALGGVVGFAYMAPSLANGDTADLVDTVVYALVQMGPAPVLAIVLIALVLAFAGGVIGTAMELVTINAVGQWFCRFDVGRWGVSSDPLPDGVPVEPVSTAPSAADAPAGPATSPVEPAEPAAPATPAAPADAPAAPGDAPVTPVDAPAAPADAPATPADAPSAPAADPAEAGESADAPAEPAAAGSSPEPAAPETTVVDDGHPMGPLVGAPAAKSSEPERVEKAEKVEKDDHGPWDEVLRPEEFNKSKGDGE